MSTDNPAEPAAKPARYWAKTPLLPKPIQKHWYPDPASPIGGWWHDCDGEILEGFPPPDAASYATSDNLRSQVAAAQSWRASELGRSLSDAELAEVSQVVTEYVARNPAPGLASQAYAAMLRVNPPDRRPKRAVWERREEKFETKLSSRVIDRLCNVYSFRNYDFLKMRNAYVVPSDESPDWKRFRVSFLKEMHVRQWPIFFTELRTSALRFAYFQSALEEFGPHFGGRVRNLSAQEFVAIHGTAMECARRAEIQITISANAPDVITLAGSPEPSNICEFRK